MPFEWWSWLLTGITCTALWLAGTPRYRVFGWQLALAGEFVWIAYAITTQQFGFVIGACAFGTVYGRNLWKAHTERRDR